MIRILFFVLCASCLIAQTGPVVNTRYGKVEGYRDGTINIYKGIPFALPPVGERRWKAPQPLTAWSGIKKCTAFSASPMQDSPSPFRFWSSEFLIPKEPIDEDCLYLNVWSDATKPTDKRPVLVYIYGGGFRSGGAGCPIYDGKNMASKGIVFVSINYRVGVFGFLAHPELTKESGYLASGNYAILDMIAALKWVQENIDAFGGDPSNVTIAGQSAGAFGVNFLVASPLAKGLFHKAIAQSGGSFYSTSSRPYIDLKTAEAAGNKFAETVHCATLDDLRKLSAADLLKAQNASLITTIVDGYVMPLTILETFKQGKQNDVPILVGWNKEDRVSGAPLDAKAYKDMMSQRFGNKADLMLSAYPAHDAAVAARSQIDLGRDELFGFQDYTWAKIQTTSKKSKAYIYNFNRAVPAYTAETQFGAFHSGEIVYAYDNLHTLDRPWTEEDKKLTFIMSTYWANFVKSGDPNGKGLPKWNKYSLNKEEVMILDTPCKLVSLPTKKQFLAWEKFFDGK